MHYKIFFYVTFITFSHVKYITFSHIIYVIFSYVTYVTVCGGVSYTRNMEEYSWRNVHGGIQFIINGGVTLPIRFRGVCFLWAPLADFCLPLNR